MSSNPAQARCTLWFAYGTSVSSTKKTDPHDITEILLEVALNTITPLTPFISPPHPSLLLSLCFQLKHNFVGLIKSPWVLDIIPVLFKFHKKSLICLKKNVSFFKDLTIAYSNLIPKKLWSSNYCYIIVQVQSIYVYNIGLLFFCLKSYACF